MKSRKNEGETVIVVFQVGFANLGASLAIVCQKKGLHWDFYLIAQMKAESQTENCFESERNVCPRGAKE